MTLGTRFGNLAAGDRASATPGGPFLTGCSPACTGSHGRARLPPRGPRVPPVACSATTRAPHTWIPESPRTGSRRWPPSRRAPSRSRPRPPAVPTRPFVVPKAAAGSSSPCWGRSWTCGASRGGCPRSSSRACRPAAGAPPTASRPAAPRTTARTRTRARAGRVAA